MDFEQIIWGKRKFSDLLKDIDNRSKEKEKEIKTLISDLSKLVTDSQSAVVLVPLIASYLGVSVKNDEQLVKLAAIVQKAMNNNGESDSGFVITEAEKQQLLKEVKEIGDNINSPIEKQ